MPNHKTTAVVKVKKKTWFSSQLKIAPLDPGPTSKHEEKVLGRNVPKTVG